MKVSLSDLLQSLRIVDVDAAFIELGPVAGVRIPASEQAFLHIVLAGEVTFSGDEQIGTVTLRPGDYAVFLDKRPHIARATPDAAATTSGYFAASHRYDSPPTIRFGAGHRAARLLSGAFHLPAINPLIRALRARIFITGDTSAPLRGVKVNFESLANSAIEPGASAIITSAFDLLLLQAVRHDLTTLFPDGLDLASTADHLCIPVALSLIHAHPERRWTLASIAREVGVSRSTFAAEFTAVVGQPFMQYLTAIRMNLASEMLRWRPVSISDVAWRAGYESISSFTRAFRKHYRTTPAAYQRSQAQRYANSISGHMHWTPFLPASSGDN